ncbi:MAG: peptide chain release factor N(5)-glutamine methyltransferase [Cyanobacteria bacterium SIG32]|nr:peptide chain release factor N(5)-glutamine methyltransferase [Cyanobacteria bacterium SIG32]
MNIQEIVKILIDSGIEPNEANIEVKMLIEHFADYSVKDIIMGKKLESSKLEIVKEKAELRAKTRQPIQHIIGFAHFMDEKFIVNKDVLIPRDETEILVRKAVELINQNNFKMALDVGTGSGCIACMVAKYTDCQIIGLDISRDALNTALDNASRLNLFNKAIFRKSDVFSNVKPGESFDIIISNPPYIPPSEKANIQMEVKFDPELALYTSDEKGLEFYEKISQGAPSILNKGGYLLFELGIDQAKDVEQIMLNNGFKEIEIIKDLAGIDRVIAGKI